jgi:hypothetical protein
MRKKRRLMDAALEGSIDWAEARQGAYKMAAALQGEVASRQALQGTGDAYSLWAWPKVYRQLLTVTDGMTVMRMLADGKSSQ